MRFLLEAIRLKSLKHAQLESVSAPDPHLLAALAREVEALVYRHWARMDTAPEPPRDVLSALNHQAKATGAFVPERMRLRSLAHQRPVPPGQAIAYVVAAGSGGLVLLMSSEPGRDEPILEVLWLNALTRAELVHKCTGGSDRNGYMPAYLNWRDRASDTAAHKQWHESLDEVTRWLWDVAIGPLSNALRARSIKRVALVPSGLLGLLPLHAAWTLDGKRRRYAIEDICITYVPGLADVEDRWRPSADDAKVLLVGEPTQGHAALPSVVHELSRIQGEFGANRCSILHGSDVHFENVRQGILASSVVHFSCHAVSDLAHPLDSYVRLAQDDRLTVQDLLTGSFALDLVVLAACETALPGVKLPDECLSLAAAFKQAGARGVIATHWPIEDEASAAVMIRFYQLWHGMQFDHAEALRQAQVWVRNASHDQIASLLEGTDPGPSEPDPVNLGPYSEAGYWAAFSYTGV
jgi:CHAT domain-containing protein